jgi:site-specific DNA-methyltransferase (adenine-specific)/adenine-specific DNA-methyltransferase
MNDELRQMVIDILRRGEYLPSELARELFPPEKREYELVYHGKEREEDILANTMAVPLQPVSTFGAKSVEWHNKLIFGDNLQVMKTLLKMKEDGVLVNAYGNPGVQLVYIDPPFATKKEFSGTMEQRAYQDRVAGAAFIEFLRKRLVLLRELLSDNGGIYVHLDWKKAHYIKLILDELFGENNFVNDIIWYYRRWNIATKLYSRNHDILLYYRKSNSDYIFNNQYIPKSEKSSGSGRAWQSYFDEETGKRKSVLLEEDSKGVPMPDVWEISMINPVARERTDVGYPTQKPEALLDRIIRGSTNAGDIVLDAFAGSGTTLAVAEKLGRRWIGIDCGKLAIYTIQRRMLNLRKEIGNKGRAFTPKSFTLYNAGLYDFSTLKQLPWNDWRFFALQLFGCKDEPHTIGGLNLDGKFRGASVLVFDHIKNAGKRIDENTIRDIHSAIGRRIGTKFFIVAPRGVFDFQQDYIDFDCVRYYALRIPYSIINELHFREFTALQQPNDETAVNETVDAIGFDFIQPPNVDWSIGVSSQESESDCLYLQINSFESRARLRGVDEVGGYETFSMLMIDYNFDTNVFNMDVVIYAHYMQKNDWQIRLDIADVGEKMMVIFIDIYGNEAREIISRDSCIAAMI